MKNFLVTILVMGSISAYADSVEVPNGQKIQVKSVNTSCGSNQFASLEIVKNRVATDNMLSTLAVITSVCVPRNCYVKHDALFSYSLYIDSELGNKTLIAKDMSKVEAYSEARALKIKNDCKVIKSSDLDLNL